MKFRFLSVLLLASSLPVRADLTIVQKVEGGGPVSDITVEIKGAKSRIQAGGTTTISDAQTGEAVTILTAEHKIVRLSADKAKAAADMVAKFSGTKAAPDKPKLVSTGRKENVSGMATEVFTANTQLGLATYYVATNYPDGAAILEQMQQMQTGAFASAANLMPDYREFHGIPVRTEIAMMGQHIVTTVAAIKRDPIADSEFAVPQGYEEVKIPNLFGGKMSNVPSPGSAPRISQTPLPKKP